ncbi:non-ribosomal peptide synthetase [Thalassomonas sp. RHCl1]|uniref:non-ribosomal peptide synthetase n=1 Tax=Thalassomonas sp. RHCl1 TaxID=2995320 RepID=UPI00248C37BD|nr:non-ribosomal peptide synthetase [Thalassomonas sp. RHCl1]
MMKIEQLIDLLLEKKILLNANNGELSIKAAKGALTTEIKSLLKENKQALLAYLTDEIATPAARQSDIEKLPRSPEAGMALSFAQERLWLRERVLGSASQNKLQAAFRVKGVFDLDVAEKVFTAIIKRHEPLRTVFKEELSEPLQYVRERFDFSIERHDLLSLSGKQQEQAVGELISNNGKIPFDLSSDLMLRIAHIALAKDEAVLLFNMHHIASDGWSVGILVKEFIEGYQGLVSSTLFAPAELDIQYADFAHWQRQWSQSEAAAKQLDYWQHQLADAPELHALPMDFARKDKRLDSGRTLSHKLSPEISNTLSKLAKEHNTSLFVLLHAMFSLLLSKQSNCDDIVLGTRSANRTRKELEPLIGFFINTLVLRTHNRFETFAELVAHVKQVNLDAQSNQDVQFEQLIERLAINRSSSYDPLVQILFTMNTNEVDDLSLPGIAFSPLASGEPLGRYDLKINASEEADGILISWVYDSALFLAESIQALHQRFERLVAAVTEPKEASLADINLLSEDELHHWLHTVNDTREDYPKQQLLHELIRSQAEKTPDNIALSCGEDTLSYRRLMSVSQRLAGFLLEEELGDGQRIGLLLPPGVEIVAAMLGCLQAGACYVPLLANQGQDRLEQIIKDAGIELVMTSERQLAQLPLSGVEVMLLDDLASKLSWLSGYEETFDELAGDIKLDLQSSAYIIYTSGSTGTPKGVDVSHLGLLDYCQFARQHYYGDVQGSIVATQPAFDITVPALYLPLLTGGNVQLPGDEEPLTVLANALQAQEGKNYLLRLTPMHVQALLELLPPDNRTEQHVFVIGGESFAPDTARALQSRFPESQVYNHYGPSETVVGCTLFDVTANIGELTDIIPIGRPMKNTCVYVLDEQMQAVPPGVPGELFIGGNGVAKGYLGQAELTAEKFIPNPFAPETFPRLYRSGDLVRWNRCGQLEYLQRKDNQVKISGYRIELGEIQHHLLQHQAVKSAFVALTPTQGNTAPAIAAWVVPGDKNSLETPQELIHELKQILKGKLPDYMQPAYMMALPSLPLSANGKVAVKALPRPGNENTDDLAALKPASKVEHFVHDIWQKVLNKPVISRQDNFFEIGGNSLLAIRVINQIQQAMDEIIHLVVMFDQPTLADFSCYLESQYPDALLRLNLLSGHNTETGQPSADFNVTLESPDFIQKLMPVVPTPPPPGRGKNPKAVFLLSPPRSGSTLLRIMLAGHPELLAPPELELLHFDTLAQRRQAFSGRYKFRLEGTIRTLMEIKGIDLSRAQAMMAEFEASGMTVQDFYQYLQQSVSPALLIDKTPYYSYHPAFLQQAEDLFEDALYIHLTRHPYGMISSFEKAQMDQVLFINEHDYSTRQLGELFWLNSHQNISNFLQGIPKERQIHVSYESLVSSPEPVMQQLCDFLKVDFHQALLSPYDQSSKRMTDGVHQVSRMLGDVKFHGHKQIDSRSTHAWKEKLDHDYLSDTVWQLAESLGYKRLEQGELSKTGKNKNRQVIAAVDKAERLPLSYSQQRLWFIDKLHGASPQYNIPHALRIQGKFEPQVAEQAIAALIQRHAILRTVFLEDEQGPKQEIREQVAFTLGCHDLSTLPRDKQIAEVEQLVAADARKAFDLSGDLMVRASFARLAPDDGVLYLCIHHIACDGWSMRILINEFSVLYQSLLQDKPSPLPELPIGYADFAAWQRARLQGERFDNMLQYWDQQLADIPNLHSLPLDFTRGKEKSIQGDIVRQTLPSETAKSLQKLAQDHEMTSFMLLQGMLSLVLSRHANNHDIVLGTSVANRIHTELEPLIGFFINTLVLRVNTEHKSLGQYLAHVRKVNLDAQANQEVPFDQLVDRLNLERNPAYNPIAQIVFSMNTLQESELALTGLKISSFGEQDPLSKSDIRIRAFIGESGLEISWLYDSSLFTREHIKQLSRHYCTLLQSLTEVTQPINALPCDELIMMTEQEQKALVRDFNATELEFDDKRMLPQAIAAQIASAPGQIAASCNGQSLSYQKLGVLSARIANYMREHGITANDKVAILLPGNIDMLVAMVAVLQSGACYVPLLQSQGQARLNSIISDADIKLVITDTDFRADQVKVLPMSNAVSQDDWLAGYGDTYDAAAVAPDAGAYIIYTSGSTGTPKGVEVTHRGLHDYCQFALTSYYHQANGSLVATSPAFDITVPSLFLPLMTGSMVNLFDQQQPISAIAGKLMDDSTKHWLLRMTPMHVKALLELFTGDLCAGKHTFVIGGEKFEADLAQALQSKFPNSQIYNHYGPSETVVGCTLFDVTANIDQLNDVLPIGRPMANTQVYVMTKQGRLAPKGAVGELYIGGHGVAKGYVNQPGLTAEKFVADPFKQSITGKLYRSGDLACWNEKGELLYKGRIDEQIKLRGFRIEPGEIEHGIKEHPSIRDTVVVVKADGEGISQLVAYLVIKPGQASAADVTTAVKHSLTETLPDYMVPTCFVPLEALPLSANGKVNKRALPEPDAALQDQTVNELPRNPLEQFVYEVWQKVLRKKEISINSNFFELGGHSLLAIQVISQTQKLLGEIVHVAIIFDHPVLADYTAYLQKHYRQALLDKGLMTAEDAAKQTSEEKGFVLEQTILDHFRTLIPSTPTLTSPAKKPGKAVFLLSSPRSGSTLLRVMLAGNSQLFAPPELELLQYDTLADWRAGFDGRFKFRTEGVLRAVMAAKGVDLEQAQALVSEMEQKGMSVGEFYCQLQDWIPGRILVDKTPFYSYHPDILQQAEQLFEEAHYIHLTRHPYAMINSFEKAQMDQILHLKQHDYTTRQLAEIVWTNSQQNILSFLETIPGERQHQIAYEGMLASPQQEMRKLCDFIGVPYEPAMTNPYAEDAGRQRMTDGVHSTSRMIGDVKFHTHKGIDTKAASAWKQVYQEDFLSTQTWGTANALGYENELAGESTKTRASDKDLVIRPVTDRTKLPLSFAQQRLWFIDNMLNGSPHYTNFKVLKVKGDFNLDAAETAMARIIQRHESLRTVYKETSEGPVQLISDKVAFAIERHDVENLTADEQKVHIKALLKQAGQRVYDLSKDLLLNMGYIRLSDNEGILWLSNHHITSDGWSVGVLIKEFVAQYQAAKQHQGDPLPPLEVQYADFAHWQRNYLKGEILERQLAYWLEQLADIPEQHAIPLDKPRPQVKNHNGDNVQSQLPPALCSGLKQLAQQQGLTLFMLLQGALALMLSRNSTSKDIVIGSPMANRTHAQIEPLIGFFVNTLVLRTNTDFDNLDDYLQHVRKVNLDAQNHQDIPFDYLVEHLSVGRNLSYTPVFQIVFNMGANEKKDIDIPGLQFSNLGRDDTYVKFDLQIIAQEGDEGLFISWLYDTAIFNRDRIENFSQQFEHLLARMVEAPQAPLRQITALGAAQVKQLLSDFAPGPMATTQACFLHRHFETRAQINPQATAVICQGQRLTFGELNAAANRLAHYLCAEFGKTSAANPVNVGGGADFPRLGLLLERSIDTLVAILAALKTGIAYVPVDVNDPKLRQQQIFADADIKLLLIHSSQADKTAGTGVAKLVLDDENTRRRLLEYSSDNLMDVENSKDQPAYIIYTSGSTGKPKGVVNSQGNLRHFYHGFSEQLSHFESVQQSPWLWNASYAFDASIKSLVALASGRQLVLASQDEVKDPGALAGLIARHQIQVFNAQPLLMEYILPKLEELGLNINLIVSGDKVSPELWQRIGNYCTQSGTQAINAYGPTETTVNASYALIDSRQSVNIGRPMLNTRAFVLDQALQCVPKGAVGELYVAGDGVALGYLNREQLTDDKFPLLTVAEKVRAFATGDLVRYLADGTLEFIGRVDNQVKIRGYRIEVDEITSVLNSLSQVETALVLPGLEQDVTRKLVAYLVLTEPQSRAEQLAGIQSELASRLPDFMLPAQYLVLPEMPVTAGGKPDVRALSQTKPEVLALSSENAGTSTAKPMAEQVNTAAEGSDDVEQQLGEIWCAILNIPSVAAKDDFFKLGGHSLLAMKLLTEIDSNFGLRLSVLELFDNITLGAQAGLIRAKMPQLAGQEPAAQTDSADKETITVEIRKIWQQLLQLEQISVEDNFFKVGGHSLLGMKLMRELSQCFQVSLVVRDLYLNLTLGGQVDLIMEKLSQQQISPVQALDDGFTRAVKQAGNCILKLNESGGQRNIFCLHSRLGSALVYSDLAGELSDIASCYGLQPPYIYTDDYPTSFTELAAFYIRLMKQVQPAGKYYLLGYSLGGSLAYEIAAQLQARGDEVAYLGILDTTPGKKGNLALNDPWYLPLQKAHRDFADFSFDNWELLAKFNEEQGIEALERELINQAVVIEGIEAHQLKRYLKYFCEIARVRSRHVPPKTGIDIDLYQAETREQGARENRSELLDWDLVTSGEIRLTLARGNHSSILMPPNCQTLAKEIAQQILKGEANEHS